MSASVSFATACLACTKDRFIMSITLVLSVVDLSNPCWLKSAGGSVPSRRGMAKFPPATWRNTSLTERVSLFGLHLYFSAGMASASLVSFISASSIRRVASARTPVVGAEPVAAGDCAAPPDGCPKASRETETRIRHRFNQTPLLALMVSLLRDDFRRRLRAP